MFETVTKCRCCGGETLFKYLDLEDQPLANSYHQGEELPKYPLQVMLCESCFHSQLSVVVDPNEMFKNYLYVSGTTQTFRDHCKALAENAVPGDPVRPIKVLDIACNDGTLLGYFKELGCYVQGVDPAENLRHLTAEKGIPVQVGFWGKGAAANLSGKYDIITGTNVFAHVHDIQSFLEECKVALAECGTVILEFPYCTEMITHCEFDTIYHEHLSYFLVNSFKTIAEKTGFYISDLLRTPIHGGSIRFFLKENIWLEPVEKPNVQKVIEEEQYKGLLNKQTYINFAAEVCQNRTDMQDLVKSLKDQGKKVIGYGASAKGNTMLNFFKLDLDYIVDDNPMKWSLKTPGQNIPIRSPQTMCGEEELYIVILAWNFYKEIVERIERVTGRKHKYVLYVPKVEVR